MTQFAHNLNSMLDAEEDDPQEAEAIVAEAVAHAAEVKAHAADAEAAAPVVPAESQPAVRTIQGPAAEPIELSDVAGSALVKRLLPAFGGLVLLLLVLRRLRK
jgi:hypothetical protein